MNRRGKAGRKKKRGRKKDKSKAAAARRGRSAILRDPTSQGVPELVKAMEQIDAAKLPKLMAYVNSPVSRRVRTNDHVERTHRMFRLLEKVR
jgi:hypothetical protein